MKRDKKRGLPSKGRLEREEGRLAMEVFRRALDRSLDVRHAKRLGEAERKVSRLEKFVVSV